MSRPSDSPARLPACHTKRISSDSAAAIKAPSVRATGVREDSADALQEPIVPITWAFIAAPSAVASIARVTFTQIEGFGYTRSSAGGAPPSRLHGSLLRPVRRRLGSP
jgi:hypothetical protein